MSAEVVAISTERAATDQERADLLRSQIEPAMKCLVEAMNEADHANLIVGFNIARNGYGRFCFTLEISKRLS